MADEVRTPTAPKQIPFPAMEESAHFEKELARFMEACIQSDLDPLVARENRYRLTHGVSWGSPSNSEESHGRLQLATAEVAVTFAAVASQDLNAFKETIAAILAQMSGGIVGGIYQAVSDAADQSGNVVSAEHMGSNADAFLEALRKIEFGVDANGNVTMPALHVQPGFGHKLLAELEAQGPEFKEEVRKLREEKAQEALVRERNRLEKYKS